VASAAAVLPARSKYLFADSYFPIPEFANEPGTLKEYSEWDVFYSPHTAGNYPDVAAPHGGKFVNGVWVPVQRSEAGFPPNSVYNPSDPLAFWDSKNATITQLNDTARIISPDGAGNIYSFAQPTSFVLHDSTADATTPYKLGTVMFQFQTDGTLVDFDSIELRYTNGSGTHVVPIKEYLREYLGTAAANPEAANAFTNRVALQWDLTGLNVDTYQIVWKSQSSSMSFQKAVLDTSDTYGVGVPQSRTWVAASGNWSTGANWAQGTSSVENANVRFGNATAATVNLDANKTIGEMIFESPADVTINRPGSQKIISNTGISTTEAATGEYVINANWEFGATNLFEINAGTVRINGVVSGAYGMLKRGDGTLILSGNNTFDHGVTLWGGTLRMEGSNDYAGGTAIITGRMEVAANALLNGNGALGASTEAINLGADGDIFSNVGGGPAALFIDGSFTVGKHIALAAGNFEKRIGAVNTGIAGATYSGEIRFSNFGQTANNVKFTAQNATDRMLLTGKMTGGAATDTVTFDGAGTVVLGGGTEKSFSSATTIASGTVELAQGTSFTGSGNWQVSAGARLRVNGSFNGSGTLTLNGGTLTGSGTVTKALTLDAGDRIAPGVDVGSIELIGAQTWSGGGGYEWQLSNPEGVAGTDWDFVKITGSLNIAATAQSRFTIYVSGFDLSGFDGNLDYDWIIATASAGISGFAASDFLIDASGLAAAGTFSVRQDGNSLVLSYAAVPEPRTIALMMLAMGVIAVVLKKRQPRGDAA